jgi:putative transposase
MPHSLYHVYNRGNNREKIFFNRDNYVFFLEKFQLNVFSLCDLFCYCLMPNHFHFLIHIPEPFDNEKFSNNLRVSLRSYARAVNNQQHRSGSLFQQHTKFKCLNEVANKLDYGVTCFSYIHQNPLVSGLVSRMEDWEFSSFADYIGKRNGTMCNQELAFELIGLPENNEEFYRMSYDMVNPERIKLFF